MKLIPITALIVAALCSQVTAAEEIKTEGATEAKTVKPLTRAEVRADLILWRQSGMQDLDREDGGADIGSVRYRQALACYQALRASPEFEQLAMKIEYGSTRVTLRGGESRTE